MAYGHTTTLSHCFTFWTNNHKYCRTLHLSPQATTNIPHCHTVCRRWHKYPHTVTLFYTMAGMHIGESRATCSLVDLVVLTTHYSPSVFELCPIHVCTCCCPERLIEAARWTGNFLLSGHCVRSWAHVAPPWMQHLCRPCRSHNLILCRSIHIVAVLTMVIGIHFVNRAQHAVAW